MELEIRKLPFDVQERIMIVNHTTRTELSSSYITFTQHLQSSLGSNIASIGHQLDSMNHQILGHSTDLFQLSEQVHALASSPHANIDYHILT